jgi:Coenzyme F420-dependent N5,N10-methylene tetrahydromethanopterin reductase and related flavin-dependent oxidoreductases
MMDHDERYERAQEFLEVACKLWDSVEKDALIGDREKGIFADPAKVHRIDHRGRYFNVRGPLPALPSPQQRPVIIQAGLSGPGMDLAATYADMQFSTRRTVATMKQHRAALDAKLASVGRKPRDVGILWSIRIPGRRIGGRRRRKGAALSGRDHDRKPVWWKCRPNTTSISPRPGPACASPTSPTRCARRRETTEASRASQDDDPAQTVEEFGRRFLVDRILVATGTPKSIVDKLEEIHFASGANGGFILGRGYAAMDNIREFVELVVPELQRRGLSKKTYTGSTLRDNLN